MYKSVLQHIENVSVWPIISLVIFVAFFIVLLWWTFTADPSYIVKMKQLPTETDGADPEGTAIRSEEHHSLKFNEH